MSGVNKKAECIKQISNFTKVATNFKLDNSKFDPDALAKLLAEASPKLESLFANIEAVDKADYAKDKRRYKHCIYVDFKGVHAKVVAAAFIARGFTLCYTAKHTALSPAVLEKTAGRNFLFMSSTAIYGRPMGVRFRRSLMDVFNGRPGNINGDEIRFVILDSGFREGLDCFDIKYVHILQGLSNISDEKQAIGRSTRMCGQRGLHFDPKRGWPLEVYKYDVVLPDHLQNALAAASMFELYIKNSNIDLRQVILANEFEGLIPGAAADAPLTKAIHNFSISGAAAGADANQNQLLDMMSSASAVSKNYYADISASASADSESHTGGAGRRKRKGSSSVKPPLIKRSLASTHKFVEKHFAQFKWNVGKLENTCEPVAGATGGGREPQIMELTASQNFVRYWFQPASAYKGILINHGVGTGKTCLGVAVASTSWEREGYSILWVTRHTLKADIWKNMFDQVCSLVVKDRIEKDGEKIELPLKKGPLNYASDAWIQPISFKQFSNLCEGKNEIYKQMVERNGTADPLRKTLIILDEAHKLFSKDIVGSEKPKTSAIIGAIAKSYAVSKAASARVMLMTATPYTTDPMDFVRLMNILREADDQLPSDFADFEDLYLDDYGKFTDSKRERFMNEVAGQISYLNREKDARQFAYPVFHSINVPMSVSTGRVAAEENKKATALIAAQIQKLEGDVDAEKGKIKDVKEELRNEKSYGLVQCKARPVKERAACKDAVAATFAKDQAAAVAPRVETISKKTAAIKDLKSDAKKLAKKTAESIKNDISQESVLRECFGKNELRA